MIEVPPTWETWIPSLSDAELDRLRSSGPHARVREAARDELSERRWRATPTTTPEGGCPHVP